MLTLYPLIEPYEDGKLAVSPLHTLYYEECGNPAGKPVVFLHGGPGGGTNAEQRRFFDPRALPHRALRPARLRQEHAARVARREHDLAPRRRHRALRAHLGIERWQVFGGSWGSTLALAYAEKHPERVTELVLRGIFLLPAAGDRVVLPATARARSFPTRGRRTSRRSRAAERGDLLARVPPAADERRSGGAAGGGARVERLGGEHGAAHARPEAHRRAARATHSRSRSRASSATTS